MIVIFNQFNLLKDKFEKVKCLGWIESTSNGRGNIGMTFERAIGITPNQFEIPDFAGIEIKTKQEFSTPYITLFSATFDGAYLFEMKRITNSYGIDDPKMSGCKTFYTVVNAKRFTYLDNGLKLKIDVDYSNKKVYLCVFDINNRLIERQSYWSFELLKEKLERKLQYLALVNAKRKFVNGKEYFYYYNITFMKLKGFEYFLKLLADGNIKIYFKVGVYRSGSRVGKYCDHGTGFDIRSDDLRKLFSIIV